MALFTLKDLKQLYSWTAVGDDDPRITGSLDATLLSRKEGYEVLYFINAYMKANGLTEVASGQKIEKLLHEAPSNIRSQENLREWVKQNW